MKKLISNGGFRRVRWPLAGHRTGRGSKNCHRSISARSSTITTRPSNPPPRSSRKPRTWKKSASNGRYAEKHKDEWQKLIDKANDQAVSAEERDKSKKAAEKNYANWKPTSNPSGFDRSHAAAPGERTPAPRRYRQRNSRRPQCGRQSRRLHPGAGCLRRKRQHGARGPLHQRPGRFDRRLHQGTQRRRPARFALDSTNAPQRHPDQPASIDRAYQIAPRALSFFFIIVILISLS